MKLVLEYSGQRYIFHFNEREFRLVLKFIWEHCDSCKQAYKPKKI